jgi:hypothetical protein
VYAPKTEIHFERLAINQEQIKRYNLPTRPSKPGSHSKNFPSQQAVELDALPIDMLEGLVRAAIERNIDRDQWDAILKAEQAEPEKLRG